MDSPGPDEKPLVASELLLLAWTMRIVCAETARGRKKGDSMENVSKGADELGKAMEEHPDKANEAEGKAKGAPGQHVGQGTADEVVNNGSDLVENQTRGQNQ